MNKSSLKVKFKNNRKKEYEILFTIESENTTYVIYTLNEIKNDELIVYAAKTKNNKDFIDITNKNEKEMIENILINLSKEE